MDQLPEELTEGLSDELYNLNKNTPIILGTFDNEKNGFENMKHYAKLLKKDITKLCILEMHCTILNGSLGDKSLIDIYPEYFLVGNGELYQFNNETKFMIKKRPSDENINDQNVQKKNKE